MTTGTPRLRVLVVDDEKPARDNVLRLLADDVRFDVVGEAVDGIDALVQLDRHHPDVVVLDVQMPGLNGFEVLASLGGDAEFAVVFSTAHDEFALRAFDAHAVDYLLKPYRAERFQRALDKVHAVHMGALVAGGPARFDRNEVDRRSEFGTLAALAQDQPRLALRELEGAWVTFRVDEMLWLAAHKKQTRVVLASGAEHVVRSSLRDLEQKLDCRFARTHRSEIVNLHAVRKVEPWTHGDAILSLSNGSTRVLTRTHRKAFLEALRQVK